MNQRLTNGLLFVALGIATYLSSKLWLVFPYPNIMNLVAIILSFILLIVTIYFLAKTISPKTKFIEMLFAFLGIY